MLYAMASAGRRLLCLGGVQALAALAFGIEDVEPVDMIVGAGNAYVAEAKRQLFGRVGSTCSRDRPRSSFSQTGGRPDARRSRPARAGRARADLARDPGHLVAALGAQVLAEIARLARDLADGAGGGAAWRTTGTIAVVEDDEAALDSRTRSRPSTSRSRSRRRRSTVYLDGLRNYGSLFLGDEATVAYGDKAVGTNHVLPTTGAARYTGGLWVGKFLKTLTYQRLTEEGTRRIAPAVAAISDAENFGGHGLTATMRLERVTPYSLPRTERLVSNAECFRRRRSRPMRCSRCQH